MYGEWTPTENTLLFPTWLYVDPAGNTSWQPTPGPGLWAELENLQYNLVPLETGTEFWLSLTAVDFGGNEDWVDATSQSPKASSVHTRPWFSLGKPRSCCCDLDPGRILWAPAIA